MDQEERPRSRRVEEKSLSDFGPERAPREDFNEDFDEVKDSKSPFLRKEGILCREET